ncbi:dienelactone hydrolase family protein [bacterium Scap17]|nr:dienelactone hydrolase family protein [bacterium Scap17]
MARLTAKDFAPELLELYDGYVHGNITRRQFLDRAAAFAVAGMTATSILASLSPDYALASQVEFTDPDIVAEYITYPSPEGHGEVRAYLVKPAKAGYIALAPDGLSSVGGYPGNDPRGKELQAQIDPEKLMNDFFAAIDYLMSEDRTTGKIGITGFCYGGGVSNAAAVAYPELACAVPFYGRQPRAEEVAAIKPPLLLHYAEHDERVNAGWPAYEAALEEHDKVYEAYIYPDTHHGFHNDSTPRYDEQAARLAWDRTLEWFAKYLT